MALNKKYADLPDLDLAPDVYETPELTDDASTIPTSTTVRSPSPAYDDEDHEIDRHGLQPDEARSHFSRTQVDARGVDFSDSISGGRISYRTSSRRRRRWELGAEELGDLGDDEDESLERRLARLQREAEEVKQELEKKRAQNEEGNDGTDPAGVLEDGVEGLSKLLDSLNSSTRGGPAPASAEGSLSKMISTGPRLSQPQSNGTKPSSLAVQQEAAHSPSTVLSQAATFERRLALLEVILGSPPSSTLAPDTNTSSTHVLPTLTTLSNQLTILTATITPTPSYNPSHLDDLSSRVAKLKANADALTTARKDAAAAAKEAANAESHLPSPPSPSRRRHSNKGSLASNIAPPPVLEDSTHTAKIHALHSTLPTINALSPLLPSVLERLRSLRSIHAGAATASEDLEALEKAQEDLRAEIARWREGLDEVERKMREGEMAMGRNLETVGKWVGALEERVKQLQD